MAELELVKKEDLDKEAQEAQSQYPQRFGNYLVLDHLIDGGMAKICRARYLGEEAEKLVAIKMVRPQFSSDPEFKKMFIDEIKVSFGLIHPNISQTYDYGMIDRQLFVAMEYIDGKNLKQYLERLIERKVLFPVEMCVYIASKICEGLSYAHTYVDKLTGKQLNIVHRDISPHNIMMTFDGAVKVIDFGIAKTETNSEATQAGTIKGKISYLAPEYLEGQPIDGRYDMFAVGLTLWELLCGRKVFEAENEIAILKKVLECHIKPPSNFNPHIPPELDAIILKACARDPKDRYENMDAFNRELVKLLFSKWPDFNPTDLKGFAQELFSEEIAKDREKFLAFGKIDITPYLRELKEGPTAGQEQNPESTESAESTGATKRIELDFGFQSATFRNNDNLEEMLELDFEGKKKSLNLAKKKDQELQNMLMKKIKDAGIDWKKEVSVNRMGYVELTVNENKLNSERPSFFNKSVLKMVGALLFIALLYNLWSFLNLGAILAPAQSLLAELEGMASNLKQEQEKERWYETQEEKNLGVKGLIKGPTQENYGKAPASTKEPETVNSDKQQTVLPKDVKPVGSPRPVQASGTKSLRQQTAQVPEVQEGWRKYSSKVTSVISSTLKSSTETVQDEVSKVWKHMSDPQTYKDIADLFKDIKFFGSDEETTHTNAQPETMAQESLSLEESLPLEESEIETSLQENTSKTTLPEVQNVEQVTVQPGPDVPQAQSTATRNISSSSSLPSSDSPASESSR